LPGRFEVLSENPRVILDGAHNPAAARVLAAALKKRFQGRKGIFLTGFMGDKDIPGILKELAPLAREIIITRPDQERAFDPAGKSGYVDELTKQYNIRIIDPLSKALGYSIKTVARGNSFLVVTGSLYMVGEAKELIVRDRS